MLGDFKGGTFRTVDNVTRIDAPNQLVTFDPHKPHLSEHFSGTKFAVTFYYNKHVNELSTSDKARARSLGFQLDLGFAEPLQSHRPVFDPLNATSGTDVHVIPPEVKEGASEPLESIIPRSLAKSRPETTHRKVIKSLPKGARYPYAGGTARSQSLLENIRNMIRRKDEKSTYVSYS